MKNGLLNIAAAYSDEFYRAEFIAEHRLMTYETDEDRKSIKDPDIINEIEKEAREAGLTTEEEIEGYLKNELDKGRNIYKLREVSDQERDHLEKITYIDPNTNKPVKAIFVSFNGIFNDINTAAKYAVQDYVATLGEDGKISEKIYKNIYFVHTPEARGLLTGLVKLTGHKIKFLSEMMIAGYHKFLEGSIGDLSNSGIQAVDLMKRYGKDGLFIGAHSRGTLLVDNALRHLNTQENRDNKILSRPTIKMVGPAANVHNADQRLNQL